MTVDETARYKKIYMEDTSLNLINKVVGVHLLPNSSQPIEYYINSALAHTGWSIGLNESNDVKQLEFTNNETLLQRIKKICEEFGVEFYFETDLDSGYPDFKLHLVKRRLEGEEGFRISSDDLLGGLTRKVNIDNIVTKLIVEGKQTNDPTANNTKNEGIITVKKYGQPNAKKFDNTKVNGATPVSINNWNLAEVDRFKMNSADPAHVTGAYIDSFLRNYYADSPLIGHGQKIKDYADYFGISVGAFMGVVAKETTFGRAHPGKVDYNFGCIRWTSNSGYPSVSYAGSLWNKYPDVKTGIAAWFKLVRYNYIETGQVTYKDFLNKYSPTFENNHDTFKNLMWGVLKSFGYDTSDTETKNNYSKSTDNPTTLNIVNSDIKVDLTGPSNSITPSGKTVHDEMIDKMIKWFKDREGKVTYSMNARSGPNSYDCSSALYSALFYAGFKPNINYLGSTVSLWNDIGTNKLMYEINRSDARRGDIFLSGAKGSASAGASGHTGVFLDNKTIIHCTYSANGIITSGMERAGSPVYCFRLVNNNPSPVGNGSSISSKTEQAVQIALQQKGKRYVWGAVGPNSFDCSGLIKYAYEQAGFKFNHRPTTATMANQTSPFKKISRSELRRGDLILYYSPISHVGIYLGNDKVVHAATEALGVIEQGAWSMPATGYVRVME